MVAVCVGVGSGVGVGAGRVAVGAGADVCCSSGVFGIWVGWAAHAIRLQSSVQSNKVDHGFAFITNSSSYHWMNLDNSVPDTDGRCHKNAPNRVSRR